MNKSIKVMLIVLLLVVGVAAVYYYSQASNSIEPKLDEVQPQVTSEEMKIQTITTIAEIVVEQLLANMILNIEVTPQEDRATKYRSFLAGK